MYGHISEYLIVARTGGKSDSLPGAGVWVVKSPDAMDPQNPQVRGIRDAAFQRHGVEGMADIYTRKVRSDDLRPEFYPPTLSRSRVLGAPS